MTVPDDANFDRRYDAAFQRGFDAAPSDPRSVSGRSPLVDSGPADVPDPVPDGTVQAGDGAHPLDHPRNPYVRTLRVLSAVFIVVGAGSALWGNLVGWYPSSGTGRTAIQMQILQSLALQFGTPLVTVGFTIGIALIFFKLTMSRSTNTEPRRLGKSPE